MLKGRLTFKDWDFLSEKHQHELAKFDEKKQACQVIIR